MPEGLKNYLNSLHRAGRKAVKKSGIKEKPFFFSGRKKKKARKKVVSHKRITEKLEPVIFTKGVSTMAKKRRKATKKVTHKAARVYGRKVSHKVSRKSRRARRYHGAAIGKLKPIAILTEVGGLAAGAVAGGFIAKFVPVANTKIKALGPILAGVILSQLKIGRAGIGKNIAQGAIAIGALSLAKQFIPQIPVFAGVESAQELLTSIQGLSAEEQALLGYDGESNLGEEVLTGMEEAEQSPLSVM